MGRRVKERSLGKKQGVIMFDEIFGKRRNECCDLCEYRLSVKISTCHDAFEFVFCANKTIVKSGGSQKWKSPFLLDFKLN